MLGDAAPTPAWGCTGCGGWNPENANFWCLTCDVPKGESSASVGHMPTDDRQEKEGASSDLLPSLNEESQRIMDETDGANEAEGSKETNRKDASVAESTTSLKGTIDGAETTENNPPAGSSSNHRPVQSTPETTNPSIGSNGVPNFSSLCPSPSFLSGTKTRLGSGLSGGGVPQEVTNSIASQTLAEMGSSALLGGSTAPSGAGHASKASTPAPAAAGGGGEFTLDAQAPAPVEGAPPSGITGARAPSKGRGSISFHEIDTRQPLPEKTLKEWVEGLEELRSNGCSLELIVEDLYKTRPPLSTFRDELATQTILNAVWLRIDKAKQFEDRVKVLRRERLERLPLIQMEDILKILLSAPWIDSSSNKVVVLVVREDAMLSIQKNERIAVEMTRLLALWKQSLGMARSIEEKTPLNEFLESAPHFRAGFNASNKDMTAMAEYITKHIDTELDLISIGVAGEESNVEWYSASPSGRLHKYLELYEASRGISLMDFAAKLNGKLLFQSDLKWRLSDLGISDGDIVTLSPRALAPGERVPLKQLHVENKVKKSSRTKSKQRSRTNKRGSGKKQTLYVSPDEETEKLKEQHSSALSRVFEEADRKFRGIRERLAALTLQRTLPKERSKTSKPLATTALVSNPAATGVEEKAGKSSFLVLVGEAENLYKTSKKPKKGKKRRQPKSNHARAGKATTVDLHGLTREQALARLDHCLVGWIDAAMKGSYPFVVKVQIVCGCGNQVLADTVEAWIRRQKNVANAPKNGTH